MTRLVPIGRSLFAVALIGLGTEHFLFRDFVTGRAPAWPASIPGGAIWAYLTGVAFVLTGAAILLRRRARPVVVAAPLLSGQWTGAGKALTFVGGLLAVAGTLPKLEAHRPTRLLEIANLEREPVLVGRVCLGLFLLLTGIQHFLFTEFVASLIPVWFPGDAVFWTYFAGVALISGGLGLLVPRTARLAAFLSGCMVFSWFWIVHLPRTFRGVSDGIAVFEALAVAGIAWVLAGSTPAGPPRRRRLLNER
jgi:uncharacterized membrane protein